MGKTNIYFQYKLDKAATSSILILVAFCFCEIEIRAKEADGSISSASCCIFFHLIIIFGKDTGSTESENYPDQLTV